MRSPSLHGAIVVGLALILPGCNILRPLAYFFSPPHIQKAEYKLTQGPLLVLIDSAHPEQDNPVFDRALHEQLVEVFRERKVNAQVVPLESVLRLRQQNPDFARWSVPRVGHSLGAEQVLSIRVERLQLLETPGSPVISPETVCRVRVFSADELSDKTRLWPPAAERDGREITCHRPPQEAADAATIDTEAAKLGKDAAQLVATPFYDVDLEEKTPREQ